MSFKFRDIPMKVVNYTAGDACLHGDAEEVAEQLCELATTPHKDQDDWLSYYCEVEISDLPYQATYQARLEPDDLSSDIFRQLGCSYSSAQTKEENIVRLTKALNDYEE